MTHAETHYILNTFQQTDLKNKIPTQY
jgi:hypothetical protein